MGDSDLAGWLTISPFECVWPVCYNGANRKGLLRMADGHQRNNEDRSHD